VHYAHYCAIIRIIFLSYYCNDYLFPNLLYALCFYQHIICIISIMAIKIIGIMRIIDIIALNLCIPLSSGVWLLNQGLTAGMHSHISEAAIAAKILRNQGGRSTSVWAGTPKKQAFSAVFDPQQPLERDAIEQHIWPNVYVQVADALLREPIRIGRAQPDSEQTVAWPPHADASWSHGTLRPAGASAAIL
jgi:hypothetical protein